VSFATDWSIARWIVRNGAVDDPVPDTSFPVVATQQTV